MSAPLPCPFCGKPPKVMPTRPDLDGDGWAAVACVNKRCAAKPRVENYTGRSSAACKAAATRQWNRRTAI